MKILAPFLTVLVASAAASALQETPTLVSFDFVATSEDGRHAAGLTPGDVSLKLNGRDHPIRRLEVITLDAGEPPQESAAAPTPGGMPPPYGETVVAAHRPRRSVLLLIDEGTLFGMEQVVRDAVAKLVVSLSPNDRLGVVSTRADGISVPLTNEHQAVKAAVDSLSLGRGSPSLCFGGVARQVLSLAQLLPRGRASTLALISRGANPGNSAGSGSVVASGECMIRRDELLPLANAISATQINYRVFNVGAAGASSALEDFAGATGADTSLLSFADAGRLAGFAQSVTHFYRASIDADPSRRDQLVRVELRVNRPGARVQAPTHLAIEPVKPPPVDAAELLRGEARRADLPIRISAFASRNDGPRPAKLLVIVEPAETSTKFADVIISLVGAGGEVAGRWTARPADLAQVPLMAALPVAAGTYRVRVGAVDDRGRGGIAEYMAETLHGSGEVKMSSLVLGVSPNGQFTPKLLFGSEPAGIAYLEIYNARPTANVQVTFELASSADGPAAAKIPAQMSAGQIHTAIGQIPVNSLPPGDTLVRAIVTVDGSPAGQVMRTLRRGR